MHPSSIRALLIEDDALYARLISRLLALPHEVAAFEVDIVTAPTLAQGLTVLSTMEIDVVLLDLTLPDSKVLDGLTRLQHVAPRLPIIILTGSDDEALALEAIRVGAQDYLLKTEADRAHLMRAMRYAIERKSAEVAIHAKERRNQALLSAIPDTLIHINSDGHILDYRPGQRVLMRHTEAGTGDLYDMVPLSLADGVMRQIDDVLEARTVRVFQDELTLGTDALDVEVRIVPQNADEALVVIRDISDWKAAQRLKDEFISVVNHELRTPLTSISGSLGLLARGVAGILPVQTKQMIDIAFRNSQRLIRLINDILDVQRIEVGKLALSLERVDLNDVVYQAVEANRVYAELYNVRLHLDLVDVPIRVRADADRIGQVVTNLLSNAVKFSASDDHVDIRVRPTADGGRVEVQDYGEGIHEAFQPHIFEKFAQADSSIRREVAGSGLGLSICKSIIDMHGGAIGFETTVGEGTMFYFELPSWANAPDPLGQDVAMTPRRALKKVESSLPSDAAAAHQVLHIAADASLGTLAQQALAGIADVHTVPTLVEAGRVLRRTRIDAMLLTGTLCASRDADLLKLTQRPARNIPVVRYTDAPAAASLPGERVLPRSQHTLHDLRRTVRHILTLEHSMPRVLARHVA
ncbi:MAG: hybrid sensor histidine kinase/response regulator [Bacteroidota bacterium]